MLGWCGMVWDSVGWVGGAGVSWSERSGLE